MTARNDTSAHAVAIGHSRLPVPKRTFDVDFAGDRAHPAADHGLVRPLARFASGRRQDRFAERRGRQRRTALPAIRNECRKRL